MSRKRRTTLSHTRRGLLAWSALCAGGHLVTGCMGQRWPTAGERTRWPERSDASMNQDVVIVGGGPAGLSAALTLGRALKKVLLCDGGVPRNAAADEVHNFVTRDGTPPREFRRIAREQLGAYPSVSVRDATVVELVREGELLRVLTDDGAAHLTRRVLLTVGVADELPGIPGVRALWGHSIAQCPYCHGWEVRGLPWGVVADSIQLAEWSLLLTGWTDDLVVFTEGLGLPPRRHGPPRAGAGPRRAAPYPALPRREAARGGGARGRPSAPEAHDLPEAAAEARAPGRAARARPRRARLRARRRPQTELDARRVCRGRRDDAAPGRHHRVGRRRDGGGHHEPCPDGRGGAPWGDVAVKGPPAPARDLPAARGNAPGRAVSRGVPAWLRDPAARRGAPGGRRAPTACPPPART
ncbi:uncharacterized protein SOCE26_103890 [Sorangium cellulosum]|uniref:FAD/NAD(P)-binding domain-containing protein n=1 Tax=Sorangium cellulosum TaxID=56 RepID=A0A2L0FB64_SORCE|nr:uncharacterized protein SOCE26_103890 [Sorangium cellulosum]